MPIYLEKEQVNPKSQGREMKAKQKKRYCDYLQTGVVIEDTIASFTQGSMNVVEYDDEFHTLSRSG